MNPVILYKNIFDDDTLAVTSTDADAKYDKDNLIDFRSYTKWKASSSATQHISVNVVDAGFVKTASGGFIELASGSLLESANQGGMAPNAIGILNHNLYTIGATVKIQHSDDGSSWVDIYSLQVVSDKAILKLFNENSVSAAYWRIEISGATAAPEIAVLMMGVKLEFPYPPSSPVIPKTETIKLSSEYSEGGHLLGSIISNYPISINHKWTKFLRSWADSEFVPFWNSHGKKLFPFFYGWDLNTKPDDVFYVAVDPGSNYQIPLSMLNYGDELILRMKGVSE